MSNTFTSWTFPCPRTAARFTPLRNAACSDLCENPCRWYHSGVFLWMRNVNTGGDGAPLYDLGDAIPEDIVFIREFDT